MKRAIGLPATTAREQSKKRGFCPVLAANAARHIHVPVSCFRVVRSAMEN
jgi:hypothetical protein